MTVGIVYAVTALVSFILMAIIYSRASITVPRHPVDRPFLWMIRCFMLFSLVDAAWGACYAGIIRSVDFFTCVGYAYHLLSCGSAFAWMLYVLRSTRDEDALHCWLLVSGGLLFQLQLIAIFCNPFSHKVFMVTEEGGYTIDIARYLLYFLQYSYYGIVIAVCSVLSLKRKGRARRNLRETAAYSMVPLCFGIAQYVFFDIAMYSMGFFAAALSIYLYRQSLTVERLLDAAAYRDSLTGLYNRRAFEEHCRTFDGAPLPAGLACAVFDVNALKDTNDRLGHAAGDDLIRASAECIKKTAGAAGTVYRTGGDEFTVIIEAAGSKLEWLLGEFEAAAAAWRGPGGLRLSVSYGCASGTEASDIEALARLADSRMYDAKSHHYAAGRAARRSADDAVDTLRDSYFRIIRIDLDSRSFSIIAPDSEMQTPFVNAASEISESLERFAKSGLVHPDDAAGFLEALSWERVRSRLEAGGRVAHRYRRMEDGVYRDMFLEILPAKGRPGARHIAFMYVKAVDPV